MITNLERSMAFYEQVLGLQLGRFEADRRVAFYWLGGWGEAMLGVWEKPAAQVLQQHFAFRSTVNDVLQRSVAFLKARQLEPHNFLDDGTERPMVFGWMPALAIYFRDPDHHSLEFIAMLPEPPRPEVGVVSWEAWQKLHESF
jgi:catechol 2,3-dioxygenase-like lactoylglutathione lyase family enzyme